MLIPDNINGLPVHQVNPCPAPVCPEGVGDERYLKCHIDASPVYPDFITEWTRTIDSETPTEFVIVDVMKLKAMGTVAFYLHSRFPWEKIASGWRTRGEKAGLEVIPEWQPLEEKGGEDLVDGLKMPVHHLVMRTERGLKHVLQTRLTAMPL